MTTKIYFGIQAVTGADLLRSYRNLPQPTGTVEVQLRIIDSLGNHHSVKDTYTQQIGDIVEQIHPCLDGKKRAWLLERTVWGNSKPNELLDHYVLLLYNTGNIFVPPGTLTPEHLKMFPAIASDKADLIRLVNDYNKQQIPPQIEPLVQI